ncbi:MAG: hypothetical protein ACXABY_16475 [Candidatus Thorarchaeota archaeon]|jgi:hypothetical protein
MSEAKTVILGYGNAVAKVTDDCAEVEVTYTSYNGCCCGECRNSYGFEETTDVDISRSSVIELAKAMNIMAKDLE